MCNAATSAPNTADMISGFCTICREHHAERVQQRGWSRSLSSISSGTIENRKMLSQQKISAVGAAALVPSTASASPGPYSRYCRRRRTAPPASPRAASGDPSACLTTIARKNAITVPSVVAIRNGGLFSSANGVFDMISNSSAGNET